MKALLNAHPQAKHQIHWLGLLESGLRKHGVEIECGPEIEPTDADFVACWGWRRAAMWNGLIDNVLVVERAYLGERMTKWISLGWNGLNGRADFCNEGVPADRAMQWLSYLKPCRKMSGAPVIIMGQVGGDRSWGNTAPATWYSQTVEALKKAGVPYRFRPHPISLDYGEQRPRAFTEADVINGPLESALADCGGVVTHSSNSGVDAVLAGVPTIATDEGSMVFDLVPHELPLRKIDDVARLRWLAKTAYCQWTTEEVENGTAWAHVKKGLKND